MSSAGRGVYSYEVADRRTTRNGIIPGTEVMPAMKTETKTPDKMLE
jgi:hypothetical protein